MKMKLAFGALIAGIGILMSQYVAAAEEAAKADDAWLKDATKWKFSNGQEVNGGAKGGFSVADVDGKKTGKIDFDFSAGGGYVTASCEFVGGDAFSNIKVLVKSETKAQLLVRIKDAAQETYHYKLKYTTPGQWQELTIDPKSPAAKFGGDANGTFDFPAKKFAIGVSKGKDADKGILYFTAIQTVK